MCHEAAPATTRRSARTERKRDVTAVLVLYQTSAEESTCFRSLRHVLQAVPFSGFRLVLCDNSKICTTIPAFPAPLLCKHDPANGGVAAAYNAGLIEARLNGSEWLLLLDQDTAVTGEYITELQHVLSDLPGEVAAVVPRLVQNGHMHSPHLQPLLWHRSMPECASGVLTERVWAFNSGAVLRVQAITRFPQHYWLDFLDHAIFHELQSSGGKVYLMHARLEHNLSTQSLGGKASLQRYVNVVQAERDFYAEFGSFPERMCYRLRRLKQALGQLVVVREKGFALLSAKAAFGLLGRTPPRE